MRIRTLAAGAAFLGTAFVLAPFEMVELNQAYAWPRWESAIGPRIGGALMLAGIALAVYCSNLFSRVGGGTPVPIEPPTRLVITGLYRYSRNPIYVAHVGFLLGLFLYRGESSLLLYAAIYAGIIQTWIVRGEEPGLQRRFGAEYVEYMRDVPRWIGRRGPTG